MPHHITARQAFMEGVRDHFPYVVGSVPFALLAGFLAVKLGFAVWQALALSTFVFAGASQIVGLELMSNHAPMLVVFLSALAVNARFLMYSASLAPHTKHWPFIWKVINASTIVDASYALCLKKFEVHFENNRWYTFGANAIGFVNWVGCTYIGAFFGNIIPDQLGLEFALPLMFITISAMFLKDKPNIAAAFVSGTLAVALYGLPYNAGLIVAILCGVATGYVLGRQSREAVRDE